MGEYPVKNEFIARQLEKISKKEIILIKIILYSIVFYVFFTFVGKYFYSVKLNLTDSAPKGFYLMEIISPDEGEQLTRLEQGQYVVFNLENLPLKTKEKLSLYLERMTIANLMKKPLFGPVETFCDSTGGNLFIGKDHSLEIKSSLKGLDCKGISVKDDEFFAYTNVPNGFDSRYFGAINKKDILAISTPLYIF